MRDQRVKRSEGGGRLQALGEIADEGFHRRVPEAVEAKKVHFFHGLFGGPLLKGHAISSDKNTGAIVAETTVHENLLPGSAAEEGEKLDELLVGWRRPATDGDVYKAHAEGFGGFALPCDFVETFAAQIDDGGDAQLLNLGDFSRVGNTGEVEFFSVSGPQDGRGGGWRCVLRKKGRRENEKEKKKFWRALHNKLDAGSVA